MFFAGLSAFIQLLINVVGGLLGLLVSLLPGSPFTWFDSSPFADMLGKINYFIPLSDFVSILELWLVAVAGFYIYSIWARFSNAIE